MRGNAAAANAISDSRLEVLVAGIGDPGWERGTQRPASSMPATQSAMDVVSSDQLQQPENCLFVSDHSLFGF